jgi:hypothetical protein
MKWLLRKSLISETLPCLSGFSACLFAFTVAIAATPADVDGVVTEPVVNQYDVEPETASFVFRGTINMSAADGRIVIEVLKDPKTDPNDDQNWENVGFADITGSGPEFTWEFQPPPPFFERSGNVKPWVNGGLGRARAVFVFKNDASQRKLLRVQDSNGITPANENVIVFADINPDRANQAKSGTDPNAPCTPVEKIEDLNDRNNPCTPNYLSANRNVLSFTPGQEEAQRQAANAYYQQVGTDPDGRGNQFEPSFRR